MEKGTIHHIITILVVILVASTCVMVYLSNLKAIAFDTGYYAEKYDEFGIHDRFNSSVNLSEETVVLLEYLEAGEGTINSSFFNEKERTHLVEVRDLFSTARAVLNIAVILSMVSLFLLVFSVKRFSVHLTDRQAKEYFKRLVSGLLIGIGAAVDAVAFLFAVVALTFSWSFIWFHRLFFRSDTWMLDPLTDNLIRMFPEQFFFDIFVRIVLASVIFATILLVIGFLIKLGRPRFLKQG